MPVSIADSDIYRSLFGDEQIARLFSDSSEIRAMLLVEGALARVQGELGLIPAEAATFIDRQSREVQIDPASLAVETARNGVPVPALLVQFRKIAGAPDLMQYLHWGATSQDIMDTALALRLRRVLDIWDQRMTQLLAHLGRQALHHADLPMAARTYGQVATPTTFGAVVAGWGWPVLGWRGDLAALRTSVLRVSLGGAAGTLSAMGPKAPEVRAGLARVLDLSDPGHSWHTDRSGIARLAGFSAGLAASLGKFGEDLILLSQSGLAEVSSGSGGGSSTMPQKENPVGPSAIVALARQVTGLAATLQASGLHRQQRDGAAWFTEWLTLPQLCILVGRMLALAAELAGQMVPDGNAMARPLTEGPGLIHAETFSFALAARMLRPDAQAILKRLCAEAASGRASLQELMMRDYPQTDWTALLAGASTGLAAQDARAFAAKAVPDAALP
jgi:3-carboxy-cis,cis-muconate cycloisomerase